MLSEDKQKIYEQLTQQFIEQCFGISNEETPEASSALSIPTEGLYELIGIDIPLVHILFKRHFENRELEKICFLIEFVRAQGIFYLYSNYTEEQDKLLEEILLIANSLVKEPNVLTSVVYMWYFKEVYDIEFHQAHIEAFSETCKKLYFELSMQILDSRFYILNQDEKLKWSYHECLYFLQTASYWFLSRKEEFPVLWNQVQEIIAANIYPWLEDDWTRANELFTSENTANQ